MDGYQSYVSNMDVCSIFGLGEEKAEAEGEEEKGCLCVQAFAEFGSELTESWD